MQSQSIVCQIFGHRLVSRIDSLCFDVARTPPTVTIVRVDEGVSGASLEVLLSEPGLRVCCVAVLDNMPAVFGAEILKLGTFGKASASGNTATVHLEGLLQDTEYDAYCIGEDLAGNWGSDSSVLLSKRDFHVRRDLTPPQLISTDPISGITMSCAPDGVAAGCLIPPLVLRFDEDIFRGTGNITAVCFFAAIQVCSVCRMKTAVPGGCRVVRQCYTPRRLHTAQTTSCILRDIFTIGLRVCNIST